MEPRYITSKLKNGIKLLVIPLNTKMTLIEVKLLLGSMHETKKNVEITHYMEHIMGSLTSKKYNSDKLIKKELFKRGAYSNAYVSNNETAFYIKGLYKDLDFYIDLLSNLIKNFYIDYSIVKNEKKAVIQEIDNQMVDSSYVFNLKIWRYLFKKYGYLYDGNERKKNIKKFNIYRLYNYVKKHIIPKNMVVSVICPKGKEHSVMKKLKKEFYFNSKNNKSKIIYPKKMYNSSLIEVIFIKNISNKLNNNNIINFYIIKDIPKYSKLHYMMQILNDILFNFNTGEYYKILRFKLGIIYGIRMRLSLDLNNSKLSHYIIHTETNSKNVELLIYQFFKILESITITNEQIDSAKNKIYTDHQLDYFYNLDIYEYYSDFLLYEKPIIKINDHDKIINSITYENVINEFENMKKDIFNNVMIFYYGKNNLNTKINAYLSKNKLSYNIKYKNLN